ncbi:MAG: HEPN domain-containing protein [Calditrichaeota bacterium]|nr:HEPN domain-containing protein [Calditrichota bacterium]
MDNRALAKEWFDIAAVDLSSAKYLQNMHPVPIEIICYHCQQSSEKYLKGFLALKGHEIIKTHDLILLNNLCCKHDADFERIEEECLRLTDYGVNIRYPYLMDLNMDDMKLAIKDANKIQNFILEKVSSKKDNTD